MEEYLGEITAIRHLTLSVIELTVRLIAPSTITFQAGQHLIAKIGTEQVILPIASPPQENNVEFVLLWSVSKGGALKDFVKGIKVSDQIRLEGPAGEFVIAEPNRDYLGIAGGVGIAPFAAIIPELLLSGFNSKFKLIFEVEAEEDVFYFERFNALATRYPNFSFLPMVVRPHAHWPGEVGTAVTYLEVSADFLKSYVPFICGDADFVKICSEQWKRTSAGGATPHTCVLDFSR